MSQNKLRIKGVTSGGGGGSTAELIAALMLQIQTIETQIQEYNTLISQTQGDISTYESSISQYQSSITAGQESVSMKQNLLNQMLYKSLKKMYIVKQRHNNHLPESTKRRLDGKPGTNGLGQMMR